MTETECQVSNQLKILARDILSGRVFGLWNIPPERKDLVRAVFAPLAMGAKPSREYVSCYEYLDKAIRSENGYPVFMSFQLLTQNELTTLALLVKQAGGKLSH